LALSKNDLDNLALLDSDLVNTQLKYIILYFPHPLRCTLHPLPGGEGICPLLPPGRRVGDEGAKNPVNNPFGMVLVSA
jgi:hypothetical protein